MDSLENLFVLGYDGDLMLQKFPGGSSMHMIGFGGQSRRCTDWAFQDILLLCTRGAHDGSL